VAVYLTISVGAHPSEARPVLASNDAAVVSAAVRALLTKVGGAALLEGDPGQPPSETTTPTGRWSGA
jgi:hypothetical protein